MSLNEINSLSYSSWNCIYHIVFAPKYRRMVFYKEKREAMGKILRQLCEWKGVKIIEAEVCPDHVQYVGGNTSKNICIGIHGIPEREKCNNAVRAIRQTEI